MWTYQQASGALFRDGLRIATGYSGFGEHKNRPESEGIVGAGPVPKGKYRIDGPFDSEAHGPVCFHLLPLPGNQMHGRSGFLIHGDSMQKPGLASHGCIILSRPARLQIGQSPDRELEVIG